MKEKERMVFILRCIERGLLVLGSLAQRCYTYKVDRRGERS